MLETQLGVQTKVPNSGHDLPKYHANPREASHRATEDQTNLPRIIGAKLLVIPAGLAPWALLWAPYSSSPSWQTDHYHHTWRSQLSSSRIAMAL